MSAENENVPTNHNYDGIQEYDNNMPNWWLGTLWISILFGIGYWWYYQTSETGLQSTQRFEVARQAYQTKMAELAAQRGEWTNERIQALTTDESIIAAGKEIFKMNCVACHGPAGAGGVGPNLTDDTWLHGGSPKEVFTSIKDGWTSKGMLAWGPILGEEKVSQVAAFVLTMPPATP